MDWKHATGKHVALSKHGMSVSHKHVMTSWAQFKIVQTTGASIVNQLDTVRLQQIKENRYYIQRIVEILLYSVYCARQGAIKNHQTLKFL